jgi:hypothetical protein
MRAMPSSDTDAAQRRVEAVRDLLLRRLAPAMRDRMLVHLEPIGMMAQVIERRLGQPAPELARIEADLGKVHGFARDAVGVNLDVVSWLAPEPEDASRISLASGVQECVALLRGHFGVSGLGLRHLPGDGAHEVARSALRTLLPAVLFALADEPRASAILTVGAGAPAVVTVRVEQDAAARMPMGPAPSRLLHWDEVEALAQAEGVGLRRDGDTVVLDFPA